MALARRNFLRFSAAALTLPALPRSVIAQHYPLGRVRIIVGFPVGGPVDIAARTIGPWLTERLGQPFLIENRPGESGNIATREVARAEPDGQTLLLCGPVNTINTTLFPGLDFEFTHDLVPVASLSRVPLVVVVHPTVKARTVPEFLALARAHPGGRRVAYAGNGTPQHVGIELFKKMAGVDLTLVPYLGSAPALADLLEGRVDAMFDPLPSSISAVRSGRLVPLAVTTPAPSEALPGVPAVSQFIAGYEAGSWFGLAAPKGTPAVIVGRLNEVVRDGQSDPHVLAKLTAMGATPIVSTPAEFARFIEAETMRYGEVVRSVGLRAQ